MYFKKPAVTIGFLVFISASSLLSNDVMAVTYEGLVTQIIDGNTLIADVNKQKITLKLSYIDAPELSQMFGEEAKQYNEKMVLNKKIKIITETPIKSSTAYAEIFMPFKSDTLNRWLVREGLAWLITEKNSSQPYATAEAFAKKNKLGIWSQVNPEKPSDFRKKEAQNKSGIKAAQHAEKESEEILRKARLEDLKIQIAEAKRLEEERKKQEAAEAARKEQERVRQEQELAQQEQERAYQAAAAAIAEAKAQLKRDIKRCEVQYGKSCQDDCLINKYEYKTSCYVACLVTHCEYLPNDLYERRLFDKDVIKILNDN